MEIEYRMGQGQEVTEEMDEKINKEIEEGFEHEEFLVCDEEGREDAVEEEIKETLWAFNASFIYTHLKEGAKDALTEEMIKEKLMDECETANEWVYGIIDDMDEFVEEAVRADGYGHFLNRYDGLEHEIGVDGDTYFVYILN